MINSHLFSRGVEQRHRPQTYVSHRLEVCHTFCCPGASQRYNKKRLQEQQQTARRGRKQKTLVLLLCAACCHHNQQQQTYHCQHSLAMLAVLSVCEQGSSAARRPLAGRSRCPARCVCLAACCRTCACTGVSYPTRLASVKGNTLGLHLGQFGAPLHTCSSVRLRPCWRPLSALVLPATTPHNTRQVRNLQMLLCVRHKG